jgi:hypothetical protein
VRAAVADRLVILAATLVVAGATSVVAAVRPAAARDATRTATIHIVLRYSGLPSAVWRGTFVSTSSTGKIVDRGTVVDRPRQRLGVNWAISRTLFGKSGTLRFGIVGPYRRPTVTLTWTILGGTRAYAGLHGSGKDVEHIESSRADALMRGVPVR